MALIDGAVRTADIVADVPVDCLELARDAFERLMRDHPRPASRLLANLCWATARRPRVTTAAPRTLSA